jgi:hypothetical protein
MIAKAAGALVVVAALFLAGCVSQPIMNVSDAPVATNKAKLTQDDVQQAIIRAGARLGWQMKASGPGTLTGTLALRQHVAVVDINNTATSYSIKYKDSTNLDAKDGSIHRNYNGWIQNLDKAIKAELLTL